jgi:hypothetical protein
MRFVQGRRSRVDTLRDPCLDCKSSRPRMDRRRPETPIPRDSRLLANKSLSLCFIFFFERKISKEQ